MDEEKKAQIMFNRIPLPIRLMVVVIPLGCIGISLVRPDNFQSQTVVLPDKTRIELQGVTFGKRHLFRGTEFLWTGQTPGSEQTLTDSLVLWFAGKRDPKSPRARWGIDPKSVRIYDDKGYEYVSFEPMVDTRYLPLNRHAVRLKAFPRREKSFIAEITYGYRYKARFRIQNPHPTQTPAYIPERLPSVKRDSELAVTLLRLDPMPRLLVSSGPMERIQLESRTRPWKRIASFQYRFRGKLDPFWYPGEINITDAAGNSYSGTTGRRFVGRKEILSGLEYIASDVGEPLKVEAWFYRTPDADFAEEETLTLGGITASPQSFLHRAGSSVRSGNLSIQLHEIQDCECVGKRTCMEFHVMSRDPHIQIMLQVRNERGELANGIGMNERSKWIPGARNPQDEWIDGKRVQNPPYQRWDFIMDLPRNSSKLKLTFAVNRGHWFSFIPPPPDKGGPTNPH